MRAWIWAVTHDAQSLEDLRQDSYEQLLEVDEGEIATIGSVEAYARRVCRNRALNWLRTRNHRRRVVEYVDTCDVYADGTQSPEVILRTLEWHEDVRTALDGLTERRRSVLILTRMYGFTAKEIAMKMGIKVSTVKRLLYDATLSLEEILNREGAVEELYLLEQISGAKE
jgi:RNA polymerase sigma-70 factor (ECF subfamily)